MENILDPSALMAKLPSLLPSDAKSLSCPQDAIAAFCHSLLTSLDFRLSNNSMGDTLPDGWNRGAPEFYNLQYKHPQSSLEFVIKISKMGSRTVINAIATESSKIASFDFSTSDFTSASFFPCNIGANNDQPLIHGFISSNRVSDFISQLKLNIVQKLIPGLQKVGYQEEVEGSTVTDPYPPSSRNPSSNLPQPRNPPYAPNRDIYHPPPVFPDNPDYPVSIGRRDMEPFPTNPFAPPSLFPPGGSGDGMIVGPDHPIFGRGNVPDRGPWGGDGFLPPMGAPPGARFDPVGPPGYRGGFGPLGRGRGRGNASGDPDNDEFMPPGMGDMFM